MFKLLVLVSVFGFGFYVGVQQANNPLVVNGPRIVGTVIKVATEKTEVAKEMSRDGLKTVDTMGDKALKVTSKAKDVIKTAPKVFR